MRIDSARDSSLTLREDMIADIYDSLDIINPDVPYVVTLRGVEKTFTFSKSLNKYYWKTDPLSDGGKELPCIVVYDQASEETDNGTKVDHTLEITLRHLTGDGKNSGQSLKRGIQDALSVIEIIEDRLLFKYNLKHIRFKSTDMGVEMVEKKYGFFDAVLEVKYYTQRWTL